MMRKLIGENKKKVILFFSNYLPLQIWTLKICNHDTCIPHQLVKIKKKKLFIFFELSPFADLDFKNLYS